MKTGVVVKLEKEWATVMRSDGTFQKIRRKKDYAVGAVISVPVREKKLYQIAASVVAACFIFCVLSAAAGLHLYRKPVSIVSMDINPSIEFSLNRFGKVVSVKAWNREGERVLREVPLKDVHYQQAVRLLMSSELILSYINRENYIRVAVQSETEPEKIKESVEQVISEEMNQSAVEVEGFCVNHHLVEEAHHYGMSAGKYLAVEELSKIDGSVEVEEYNHCSIREIKEITSQCSKGEHHEGHEGMHHCR